MRAITKKFAQFPVATPEFALADTEDFQEVESTTHVVVREERIPIGSAPSMAANGNPYIRSVLVVACSESASPLELGRPKAVPRLVR